MIDKPTMTTSGVDASQTIQITKQQAAVILAWKASAYAASSNARERLFVEGGSSLPLRKEISDKFENALESALLDFEGGYFSATRRDYCPETRVY